MGLIEHDFEDDFEKFRYPNKETFHEDNRLLCELLGKPSQDPEYELFSYFCIVDETHKLNLVLKNRRSLEAAIEKQGEEMRKNSPNVPIIGISSTRHYEPHLGIYH